MIKETLKFLEGKKTYIVAIIGIIANGMFAMGYIPASVLPEVNVILGFLGLAALRSAI